jgi:hypothetical protein
LSSAAAPLAINGTAAISDAVVSVLRHACEPSLRAIVLTGSLARGEGTWTWHEERARLAGDAEFIVVFGERALLPSSQRLTQLVRNINARLCTQGIDGEVELSPVHPSYLQALRPRMFACELREHGQVIWGDDGILELIPAFSIGDIPFEDAFRTLLNRLIELLEAVCEAKCLEPLPETVRYRAAKLILDMASSFLIFNRQYRSTYRGRANRLQELAAAGATGPIPMKRFAEQVCLTTKYKLGESQRSPVQTANDLLDLTCEVHPLWSWELERLVGAGNRLSDAELLRRWLREQSFLERIRGWISLVKRHGMLASVKLLPRWIPEAFNGSPRRLIYAAASELFFALPALLESGDSTVNGPRWAQPHWKLPVTSHLQGGESWRGFGYGIAWNYHHFLESTTS